MSARAVTSRPTRAGLVAWGLVGVLVGVCAATFDYAEGTSYLSNDPKACVNCHVMRDQYDAWQHSAHHAHATCNDCHVPHDLLGKYATKLDHGYRHSKGFTLDNFIEPIRMTASSRAAVEKNCVRCHGSLVGEIATDAHTKEANNCTRCHEGVGHAGRR